MEEPTDPNSNLSFDDAVDSFEEQPQQREEDQHETLDSPPPPPSPSELIKTPPDDDTSSNQPPSDPPPSLRRRRSVRFSADSAPGEWRSSRILQQFQDPAPPPEVSGPAATLDRTIGSRDETLERPNGGVLFWIAGFVVKSIFFQLNLLFSSFLVPLKLLHFSFLMVTDPFGTVKREWNAVKGRFLSVWNGVMYIISPWVSVRGSDRQGLGKLAVRVAVGCFWAIYVGFILFGILVTAFLGGSLVMKCVVEEPLRVERELNFDYTKPSPDALVSIDSKGGIDCHNLVSGGMDGLGKEFGASRVVPMNHKLQLIMSLTLPESDYNRKLGIFQVRADFLSANGRVTYSSSQPCMLRFKSPHIRFVETFMRTGSLLAGFSSESQILSIRMTGFIEGNEPTVCVRIVLEQRAEFKPGAGIPEIYAASVKLESQLPLLKRIIWNWRRTVFIWVGMMFFFFELLIVLVCCRTVIIPRSRQL